MCQKLFTGRTAHNVVEIIILFAFFPTITSKYVYQLSEKTLFLGLEDPHFQEIRYFLCLLELWGLPFTEFGKSCNKHRYREYTAGQN